ncbi:MAG: hypothetical protein ABEL04_03875 [Salinibacter sp.]|uniref:hypothetical protein n=1 Tax=Salinibacter sp. TaxID=2065818 RepID=UPI0035D4809E
MKDETKQTLFPLTFAAAALFYAWAIVSLWVGPSWSLSGLQYLVVGVIPAFLGVVCTVLALALHIELQESDSTGNEDPWG